MQAFEHCQLLHLAMPTCLYQFLGKNDSVVPSQISHTIHCQKLGFNRISMVSRIRIRVGVRIRIRARFSFSGAKL